MSFQISGFVQFFHNFFETAPPQPLPVPQCGASAEEIETFIKSLKLPADFRNRLLDAHLALFTSFFRARLDLPQRPFDSRPKHPFDDRDAGSPPESRSGRGIVGCGSLAG